MALEKIVPASPDAKVRKDQDAALARLGHVNTVIDYLNLNFSNLSASISAISADLGELSIKSDTAVTETVTSDSTLLIELDGVEYKILLKTV
jgi:hypothetical protein